MLRCCSLRDRIPKRTSPSTSTAPAASITAGMAIYDTMQYIKCDVSTICVGMAASMGAFLLSSRRQGQATCSAQLRGPDPPASHCRRRNFSGQQHRYHDPFRPHGLYLENKLNEIHLQEYMAEPLDGIERDTERANHQDCSGSNGIRSYRQGHRAQIKIEIAPPSLRTCPYGQRSLHFR